MINKSEPKGEILKSEIGELDGIEETVIRINREMAIKSQLDLGCLTPFSEKDIWKNAAEYLATSLWAISYAQLSMFPHVL